MADDSRTGKEEVEGEEEHEDRHDATNGTSQHFERRSPFIHNPPHPEERRARITNPQSPKDYIINLREDLADFQEYHGLPRTRDYNFLSLGLALAQETGRAVYSIFLLITEFFPVLAIASLVLRFALDKMIEILETDGAVPRLKKTAIFLLQITIIMVPLWIFIATIIIPMLCLLLSIFRRLFPLAGRKSGKMKSSTRSHLQAAPRLLRCLHESEVIHFISTVTQGLFNMGREGHQLERDGAEIFKNAGWDFESKYCEPIMIPTFLPEI